MRMFVCVDDTDDLTKSTSTGGIAELISMEVEKLGGVIRQGITRHQLILDERVDYTSHNSSMCFEADIDASLYEQAKENAVSVIKTNMAATANPGLCFCRADELTNADLLIDFGYKAKCKVLNGRQAYDVAEKANGVWLAAIGGNGNGIIGALAGVGLRMGGNDGTFRGKYTLKEKNGVISVGDLCRKADLHGVINEKGEYLEEDKLIDIGKSVKKALFNHNIVTMVKKNADNNYIVCEKAKSYDNEYGCGNFVYDNDSEEQMNGDRGVCDNCLYRRRTAQGLKCMFNKNKANKKI